MLVTLKQNWVHKNIIYFAGQIIDLKKIGITREQFDNTFLCAGKKTQTVQTSALPVVETKKESILINEKPIKRKRGRPARTLEVNAL